MNALEEDTSVSTQPDFVSILKKTLQNRLQTFKDRSAPYTKLRWASLAIMLGLYFVRVYILQGFYIITYGLGIFLLNLFIGFLTPIDDMELNDNEEGLPMFGDKNKDDSEFKPFARRLGEFSFWYSCTKAVLISFTLTFFGVFDVPVFWPILLIYFIVLFVLTMKRQIKHMITHKYVPFSIGKKKRYGKGESSSMRDIAEDVRSR